MWKPDGGPSGTTGVDELLAAGYSSLQEAIGAAGGRGGLMKRTRGCRGQIMILTD